MNKKIIIVLILLVVIALVTGGYFFFNYFGNSNEENNNSFTNNQNVDESNNAISDEDDDLVNTNSVVIYFSATGNTERIANMIGNVTLSEVIEIVPKDEYTSEDLSYTDDNCRANREQNDDNARPEIANTIDNIDSYDVIYLGFPIWWGNVPKIILTFLDTYDLSGKTIIPFCTSGSSGISASVDTLRNYNSSMTVLDGRRFSSTVSEDEISSWVNSLFDDNVR